MALSNKRKKFIDEYLKLFDATKAAISAGYSEKTAYSIGWELLRIPEIAKEIKQHLQSSAMSAEEVLRRLGDYARADYKFYLNKDGNVDLERLLLDDKGHLIKGIYPTKNGKRIEFYDAKSALDTLARHHNLLTDKVQQTNLDVNLSDLTDDQLKQLAGGKDILEILSSEG